MPDERRERQVGPERNDDVDVVRQHRLGMNSYAPPVRSFPHALLDHNGICGANARLPQARVPGNVGMQPECAMSHIVGG
jgi:hypothetical protein